MIFRLALVALVLFTASSVYAQDSTVDESRFWGLLEQTADTLELDTSEPVVAGLRQQWESIKAVQVGQAVVEVDLEWLMLPLGSGDSEQLRLLRIRIRALLDDHINRGIGVQNLSFAALDEVLADPRFQYAEITPTPLPPEPETTPAAGISADLSQLILTVIAIAAGVVIFAYFARNLNVQTAALENAAPGDDPSTSSGAVDLAQQSAQSRDYRSAVRYLYLSTLLLLDERGLIHYDSTLTNREHLRQIRNNPQLLEVLRGVVGIFEDVWYGYAPIDETFYQQYTNQIDQLRRMIS